MKNAMLTRSSFGKTNRGDSVVLLLLSIGSLAGLTSVLLVLQMASTRILYAMSRDHFISDKFQAIHPVFKTPALLTWTVGGLAVVGILTLNLNVAAELCNYGTFTSFIIVCFKRSYYFINFSIFLSN